jgi:type I pantothenate kinase
MTRKGFPESYDRRALLEFVTEVKAGRAEVSAPVYSHLTYDIVPGEEQVVRQPDIVIIEGLTVLQTGDGREGRSPQLFVSDFFDFSIYVDADESDIEQWYLDRFLTLRETAFTDERSFFHHFAALSEGEAIQVARQIWRSINAVNLHENILPTRERAQLIMEKAPDHSVRAVRLRKL